MIYPIRFVRVYHSHTLGRPCVGMSVSYHSWVGWKANTPAGKHRLLSDRQVPLAQEDDAGPTNIEFHLTDSTCNCDCTRILYTYFYSSHGVAFWLFDLFNRISLSPINGKMISCIIIITTL